MRLTVAAQRAGSILEEWRRLTGRSLLERYGMTEIGMALSNPYDESSTSRFVGVPLRYVQVKLMQLVGDEDEDESIGRVRARPASFSGDNLFAEYFDNEKATAEVSMPTDSLKPGT